MTLCYTTLLVSSVYCVVFGYSLEFFDPLRHPVLFPVAADVCRLRLETEKEKRTQL